MLHDYAVRERRRGAEAILRTASLWASLEAGGNVGTAEDTSIALSPYEEQQVAAIRAWKSAEPSVVSQAFGIVTAPAAWVIQQLIPDAAMRGAVEAACAAGSAMADRRDIMRDGQVLDIAALRTGDLEKCDALSNAVHNWAVGLGTAEGALTGSAGLVGMAADLPALITLAFRTIHKIGLCYGYECDSEVDTQFACGVLAASGANSITEKLAALATLRAMHVAISTQTWRMMAERAMQHPLSREGGVIAIKNLAKQLGINLTRRKALQVIPVVGAGIGASVNGWYIKDVGWTARRAFQQRWLIDNQRLIEV
jgi:hypothetical protein